MDDLQVRGALDRVGIEPGVGVVEEPGLVGDEGETERGDDPGALGVGVAVDFLGRDPPLLIHPIPGNPTELEVCSRSPRAARSPKGNSAPKVLC